LRHRRFDGGWSPALSREVAIRGPAVVALPYDPARDAVGLIQQFRPALYVATGMGWTWEAPGGGVGAGEDPAVAARREVVEETGLTLGALHPLGRTAPSPAAFEEIVWLFIAEADLADEETRGGAVDEDEDILMRRTPWAEAEAMMRDGRILAAPTLLALLRLNAMRGVRGFSDSAA
ncbi:MAG: NUDIX hydrolase, partial [Pseudomonadota bacterium]